MDAKLLGYLASGEPVYDRLKPHFNSIPDNVMELIKNNLSTVYSRERGIIAKEFCFDHDIGETLCVETSNSDEVYFARRLCRNEWYRFVKNRKPEPSNLLTIILCKLRDKKEYILIHRYIGDKGETNPSLDSKFFHNDMDIFIKAVDYWNSHAFIEGSKQIDPKTITTICPWWYQKDGK